MPVKLYICDHFPRTEPGMKKWLLLPLAVFCCGPFSSSAEDMPSKGISIGLTNQGMEQPYEAVPTPGPGQKSKITGMIAHGWIENSGWADVDVDYSADTTNPHGGGAAQLVKATRVGAGQVQFEQPITLQKGVYALHAWLRGSPEEPVTMLVRLGGAPYTSYGEKSCNLSPEWHEFTIIATLPERTEANLFFTATAPTKFWVDDVSLENMTNAVSNAPPQLGNLFNGGSFEAGISFGWSVRFQGPMRHAFADPRPSSDSSTATDGKRSLRVDIPEGDNAIITAPLLHVVMNRPYSLGLDLKSSASNTPVRIAFDGTGVGTQFTVGPTWKRYTWTGTFPYVPFTRLRISCGAPAGGPEQKLWIDAVQMEESAHASAYSAPFPYDLTLHLPRPGSVVFDGEKAAVLVSAAPPVPGGAILRLSAIDLYGRERRMESVTLPVDSFPLPDFTENRRGLFKLRGQIVDQAGKPLSAPVEMVWARLPKPREIDPKKSFFGLHIQLSPDFIAIARATGHRWVRLHDTSLIGKWGVAEPAQGHFEFYDPGVTAAHDAGLAILGMLDGAPRWATKTPRADGAGDSYWSIWNFPDSVDQWQNYVRTVVGHYRGRIDYWEVWNEPWGMWWRTAGGTPQRYAELLKAADQAAHQTSPEVQILGVNTLRSDSWTADVLAASGTNCFDALSYHDYARALFGGPHNRAMDNVDYYDGEQAKFGPVKPLWNTEGGPGDMSSFYTPETGGQPPHEEMAQAVRFDVTQIAAGIKAYFLYAYPTDPGMGDTEFCADEFDRSVKPIIVARAVLASLIDGATSLGRSEPVPGVDAFDFQQGAQKITVVWSYDGVDHEVPVPADAKVLDVLGNPRPGASVHLGAEPVYFIR
jgi:hypothetical protein